MDYKEKYEMALEGIQEILGSGEDSIKMSRLQLRLQGIFPELKESEDEKVRKWIIENIQETLDVDGFFEGHKTMAKNAIAWLEKQGESDETKAKTILINKGYPIDANGTFPTYEEMYDIIKEGLEKQGEQKPTIEMKSAEESLGIDSDTYNKIVDECIYGEQKPADKVEPKFKVGQTIKKEGFNLGFPIVKIENGFYYNDMGDNFPFTDQDNWKLVEQKPADWSEEDDKMFNSALWHVKNSCGNGGKNSGEFEVYYWLKSLKDRVQLQQKQEWSEEDYNEIETIACHLDNTDNEGLAEVLRNIRNKYYHIIPQSTWKPSEEQIKALERECMAHSNYDLCRLCEQLKKLREE